jgi:hypothetical protein
MLNKSFSSGKMSTDVVKKKEKPPDLKSSAHSDIGKDDSKMIDKEALNKDIKKKELTEICDKLALITSDKLSHTTKKVLKDLFEKTG